MVTQMKFNVVYGPPCSGKTTYVKSKIGKNDLVYDYDHLSRALMYGTKHTTDKGNVHRYVVDFRSRIIYLAREETELDNIWIISSFLTSQFRDFIENLNPNYIKMDTSKDECLKRLEKDDARPDKEAWRNKIEEWFNKYGNESEVDEKQMDRSKVLERKFEFQTRTLDTEEGEKELWVEGYASKFDSPTVLWEDGANQYKEQICRGAFDSCKMDDVIFNYNHSGKVMARTRNRTLQLRVDDKGLFIRARLDGTEEGRRLYEEIQGGYIDRMSFAFTISDEEYDKEQRQWNVRKIKKLYDVSAVDIPAYDDTTIAARKNFILDADAQEERERKAAAELAKRKLKLKAKLSMKGI